jgi:uncharacterized protein
MCRRVIGCPEVTYFKPAGRRLIELEEVILSVEEWEAIRLIDFQENSQDEAAKTMNVSQPTMHRILRTARRKVSEAIVKGKALKIEGGVFERGLNE